MVLSGSLPLYAQFFEEHEDQAPEGGWSWRDSYPFTEEQLSWFYEHGCKWIKVEAEPGDLILWDSRCIHYGAPARGERPRVATCKPSPFLGVLASADDVQTFATSPRRTSSLRCLRLVRRLSRSALALYVLPASCNQRLSVFDPPFSRTTPFSSASPAQKSSAPSMRTRDWSHRSNLSFPTGPSSSPVSSRIKGRSQLRMWRSRVLAGCSKAVLFIRRGSCRCQYSCIEIHACPAWRCIAIYSCHPSNVMRSSLRPLPSPVRQRSPHLQTTSITCPATVCRLASCREAIARRIPRPL
jgi:hypothetical protein